ncbi:TolC family protein [Undibacterium sp. 5I1]|uniref:TolC family protein n=1 Tax=unclassified Undibacterium TaxID=2630295 RepID=UPI002AB5A5C3|nr:MULTISPECIES: TolC family protein [unclassified Undibacterium]MDY7537454.1 TolC family protein [Undibacterium sp. 5I1]MEB0233207.1 TolC family protein [Undibacterium sp. 10I3]MEB0258196.1 TolC family protein [Undibacterium sp. 5I1]
MISFNTWQAQCAVVLMGVATMGLAAPISAQANLIDSATSYSTPNSPVSSLYEEQNIVSSLPRLTLQQALEYALQHNRDLKLGNIAIDTASAMKTIASAPPNPMLTLQTAGINPKLGIGAGKPKDKTVDSTIRVDQLIERGGKRDLRIENAGYLETAAHQDWHDVRRQTKQIVSAAYFDLIAAQHKLRIANETRDLFSITQAAAEKRKKAGDIAGADAARIRVDALRAENDARQAASDLLHAQTNLISLLGLTVSANSVHAVDDWPAQILPEVQDKLDLVIQKRPDVLAAKARLDAALAARKLALAARTRDISVGVQFEHYPVSASNPQGSGNSFGIGVQIPLFTRYEFQGEIRVAESAVDAANESLEKTKEAARNELVLLIESAQASKEMTARFQGELLSAARNSAEAAEFAFKNGALGVMDVLDARRTYRAIEMDAINAQADFAKVQAALRISIEEEEKK